MALYPDPLYTLCSTCIKAKALAYKYSSILLFRGKDILVIQAWMSHFHRKSELFQISDQNELLSSENEYFLLGQKIIFTNIYLKEPVSNVFEGYALRPLNQVLR